MEFKPSDVRAFRYWIQGYPNFYEPIIQHYFLLGGYEIIRRPAQVNKADIEHIRKALFDGERQVGETINRSDLIHYLGTRTRLQPDILLKKDGKYFLAEFKSWGGFNASGVFNLAMLRSTFINDLHNSAFFFVDHVAGQPISSKFLVVSSRSNDHDIIESTLKDTYHTSVELLYLDEIITHPQIRIFIEKQIRYLDAAVYELKQAFGLTPLEEKS